MSSDDSSPELEARERVVKSSLLIERFRTTSRGKHHVVPVVTSRGKHRNADAGAKKFGWFST